MRWVLAKGVDTPLQWSELGTELDITPENLFAALNSLIRNEAIIALPASDKTPLLRWQAQGLTGLSSDLGR